MQGVFSVIARVLLATGVWYAVSAQATGIVAVSPQGEVAQVRQVSVKFSEAVVPCGDLRQPDPMNPGGLGAAPAGTGRWASDRVWLCDFREALGAGVRCTLKLRAEWKPIGAPGDVAWPAAGECSRPAGGPSSTPVALTGTTEFSFGTGGPAIVSMSPTTAARSRKTSSSCCV